MSVKKASSFYDLSVDLVLKASEWSGFVPTGQYFQLNSYENRVFDLFLEPSPEHPQLTHIITKIYRPHRWSKKAIQEEHEFLFELQGQGIPVVAPLLIQGESLKVYQDMFFCFFPKAMGRMPQEFSSEDYKHIGRKLAELHNVGAQKLAPSRPTFDVETLGWQSLDLLADWVSPEVWDRYELASEKILFYLEEYMNPQGRIRIHGDCHRGNILQADPVDGRKEMFFVDFDDFINGYPVQDLWMLLSGGEKESEEELQNFLSGYEELRFFDHGSLRHIPALRGLRIIHYAAWIAKRWQDPSFPKLFPEFENYIYWAEEVEALEKIAWQLE